MLNLYTHDPSLFSLEFWKAKARPLFGKYAGPDAVRDSLKRGLEELSIPYLLNPKKPASGVGLVLSGPGALKKAIEHKRAGVFTKLYVGPNIMVNPNDYDKLVFDPEIDHILVPAPWVANLWSKEAPELTDKIEAWASGVSRFNVSTRNGLPIIYDKLGDTKLLGDIQRVTGPANLFSYGKFQREEYLSALSVAPYMVYLSQSESQGLALQEAWAHDVPTIVNNSTHWEAGELSWGAPQINCPYLTPELGAIFTNPAEIPIMAKGLGKLSPKRYCDEHLSDRASVENLLRLIS